MIMLVPGATRLAELRAVLGGEGAGLDPGCRPAVEAAAARIAEAVAGQAAVYGVNTGFGKLASVKIAANGASSSMPSRPRSRPIA